MSPIVVNRIGGVMVSVLTWSAIYLVWSTQRL